MSLYFNTVNTVNIFVKNGLYIYAVFYLLYKYKYDVYLASTVCIKLYSLNYFYWYGGLYSYFVNKRLNWIKQMVRFPDTGHIISFILLSKTHRLYFLPLAHNIQFIIAFGYWIGKFCFNMKDVDRIYSPEIMDWHMELSTAIHHSVPYILVHYLLMNEITNDTLVCSNNFYSTLFYSYVWVYYWAIFIYIPWRYITNDCVYSILDSKYTSENTMISFIVVINFLPLISNIVGYYTCQFYSFSNF